MCEQQLKRSKKTHQVEVIELFLAKLASLLILSQNLKNSPIQLTIRSHCGVVDKPLALQTRGHRFDSRLHQSVGCDFKP